jgi:hypothetical protein
MYNMINDMDDFFSTRESWERKSHYPSDALSCSRQLFWKWKGEPASDPMGDGSWYKFKMGHLTETMVEQFLHHAVVKGIIQEFTGQEKIEIKPYQLQYPISGRIDFKFLKDGVWYGLEVKSSYGNGMRGIINNRMPKDTALIQDVSVYEGDWDAVPESVVRQRQRLPDAVLA